MNKLHFPYRQSWLPLLPLLLLIWGCSASRNSRPVRLKERSADYLYRGLVRHQLQADILSARMRLSYTDNTQQMKANGSLYLAKDSLIWMNVRKLGFELARVKITTDSVFVIDRLNNQYLAEDLSYLSREFQIPASFPLLQAMVLGHPVFFNLDDLEAHRGRGEYLLHAADPDRPGEYALSVPDLLLKRMELVDAGTRRSLLVELEEYENLADKQSFSYLRKINLKEGSAGLMDMELRFSQVEVNQPRSVRFVIPERYDRVH